MSNVPGLYDYSNSVTATRYRTVGECCLLSHLYISRVELEKTHKGICFANYLGYILNVNITLSLSGMGYRTFQEIDKAQRGFEELLRKKITRYGVPYLAYTVLEAGVIHGWHAHMGLYVPAERAGNFKAWLKRRIGKMSRTDVPNVYHLDGFRADPITSQWKWFSYLMKGLDPRLTEDEQAMFPDQHATPHWLFGVRTFEYSGYIPIQRVRRSETISLAKQKSANYIPKVNLYYQISNERYSDAEHLRGQHDRQVAELTAKLESMTMI